MSGPGEVTIRIDALPDPGDAARFGDGAGTILDLEWSYGKDWISLGSPLSGEFKVLVPLDDAGASLPISVRAIGSAGPSPATAPVSLPIPGLPSVFEILVGTEVVLVGADPVVVALSAT